MQPHEQHDPPALKKPAPKAREAKWQLLLSICILLGLIVSELARRFL